MLGLVGGNISPATVVLVTNVILSTTISDKQIYCYVSSFYLQRFCVSLCVRCISTGIQHSPEK